MGRLNKTIRIAGNTESPCYWALRSLGYEVKMSCVEVDADNLVYLWTYLATKAEIHLIAENIYQLLSQAAVHEVRGNLSVSKLEIEEYQGQISSVPIYNDQGDLLAIENSSVLPKFTEEDVASYLVLKSKGYEVYICCDFFDTDYQCDKKYVLYDDFMWNFEATKEWRFSATTMDEVLALLTMWEVRGKESYTWKSKSEEVEVFRSLQSDSPLYDLYGNEIEE